MLHKLPKDLLVKLLATIKKNTEKKYIELLRSSQNGDYHVCREITCKAFAITNKFTAPRDEDYMIFNSDNRTFRGCSMCKFKFCEVHDQIMECQLCKQLLCHLCYEKYERKYFKKVDKNCSICKKHVVIICGYCDGDTIKCRGCNDR
jgi:hypothetical protein